MGSFLTGAADWLRDAGLTVIEYPDWKTRCKSSGGYSSGRPWGVMWHHTASNGDAEDDAYYQCYVADAAPISNVTIDRDGTVWLLAAGPTNTNGSGVGVRWSKGEVPRDSMNSYAFGIEICNNGGGGVYPQEQIDAAFIVSNVINAHCGNLPTDVATHYVWAPDRKVDPAKASAVEGRWQPGSCTGSGTWDLGDLVDECANRVDNALPEPQPEPPKDDMAITIFECTDADAAFIGASSDGVAVHVSWASRGVYDRYSVIDSVKRQPVSVAQLQSMILLGPLPEADSKHQWSGREFTAVVQ